MQASDPDGTDEIPAIAFDERDTRTQDQLKALWDEVVDIYNEAKECDVYGQDENAWCLGVVQNILHVGLKLSGTNMVQLKSVYVVLVPLFFRIADWSANIVKAKR
jgi:hypothetical protein